MRVAVVVENNAGKDLCGEWGLSLFLEVDERKILLDCGSSDLFMVNAARMKLNLLDLDYLVLSHGHWDHTWGLDSLLKHHLISGVPAEKRPVLVAHPLVFQPKFRADMTEFGLLAGAESLYRHYQLQTSREPFYLTENLLFLGEIPRKSPFENKKPLGKVADSEGYINDDYLRDDTALACQTPGGLVIITGCSHSGICNIVEHARKASGEERVLAIIGGFHLLGLDPKDEQLTGTVDYLGKLQPKCIYPCHCTDLAAKIALANVAEIGEVRVGLELEF